MTVESLKRVMWRLRDIKPQSRRKTNAQLQNAIMRECGTDPRTYKTNRRALVKLGWITAHRSYVWLTDKDVTEA